RAGPSRVIGRGSQASSQRTGDLPFLLGADDLADELNQNGALIATLESKLAAEVAKLAKLATTETEGAATNAKVQAATSGKTKTAGQAATGAGETATGDAEGSETATEAPDTGQATDTAKSQGSAQTAQAYCAKLAQAADPSRPKSAQ